MLVKIFWFRPSCLNQTLENGIWIPSSIEDGELRRSHTHFFSKVSTTKGIYYQVAKRGDTAIDRHYSEEYTNVTRSQELNLSLDACLQKHFEAIAHCTGKNVIAVMGLKRGTKI